MNAGDYYFAGATKGKRRFTDVVMKPDGSGFTGTDATMGAFSASFNMFLIREAWERGCPQIDDDADGFGEGVGTMGDWSAIRDSSPPAKERMLATALNFLFTRAPVAAPKVKRSPPIRSKIVR